MSDHYEVAVENVGFASFENTIKAYYADGWTLRAAVNYSNITKCVFHRPIRNQELLEDAGQMVLVPKADVCECPTPAPYLGSNKCVICHKVISR